MEYRRAGSGRFPPAHTPPTHTKTNLPAGGVAVGVGVEVDGGSPFLAACIISFILLFHFVPIFHCLCYLHLCYHWCTFFLLYNHDSLFVLTHTKSNYSRVAYNASRKKWNLKSSYIFPNKRSFGGPGGFFVLPVSMNMCMLLLMLVKSREHNPPFSILESAWLPAWFSLFCGSPTGAPRNMVRQEGG